MSDNLRPIYAANLRAERARAGMLQADLAARVGLPRATLADVEAGRRSLTLGEAVEVCAALGIGLGHVLDGDEPKACRARRMLLRSERVTPEPRSAEDARE